MSNIDFNKWYAEDLQQTAINSLSSWQQSFEAQMKVYAKQKNKERKELEKILNQLVFPEKYGNKNSQFSKNFMNALAKVYEQITDKTLAINSIGDEHYKIKTRPTLEESKTKGYQYLKTIKNNFNQIKEVMKQIDSTQNGEKIKNIIENKILNGTTYRQFEAEIQSLLNTYLGANENQSLISYKKNLSTEEIGIQQKLIDLDSIYQTLVKSGTIVLPKDYGDVLEYALQLLNENIDYTTETVSDELVLDLANSIKLNNLGAVHVDRGGRTIELPFTGEETFGDSNIKIKSQISTGGKKQGKVDVSLTLPIGENGRTNFQISAKNWITIDQLHDLGHTDILSAIDRSTGANENLEYYTFSLLGKEWAYQNQTEIAHNIAKISAIADVVMGYSQQNIADTLIILDRRGQRVIVGNIAAMILSLIKDLTNFKLKGYNESTIESYAWQAYELAQQKPRTASQSQEYLAYMYNILKTIEVTIRYQISEEGIRSLY